MMRSACLGFFVYRSQAKAKGVWENEVIVDEAESWGADLIIMGSRGLGIWNRLLLGSVSNAVVHHAKCSVEVVRTPQGKQPDDNKWLNK